MRKIADLADMIEADEIDDDQYVVIAFVSNEDESSNSDNATESDIEEEILSRLLPAGHYERIKCSYTSTQSTSGVKMFRVMIISQILTQILLILYLF